jgi:hypothetical protein
MPAAIAEKGYGKRTFSVVDQGQKSPRITPLMLHCRILAENGMRHNACIYKRIGRISMSVRALRRLSHCAVTGVLGLGIVLAARGDTAMLTLPPASVVAGAAPTTLDFPVTRGTDTSYDVYLTYHTQDGTAVAGTDYTATSGTLKLPAGASSATIPVPIAASTSGTADKNFELLIDSAVGVGPASSFAAQQAFTAGANPNAVAVADVNGDGLLDVIVVNAGDNTVSVLLNTTAPGATTLSFAARQSFATGASPDAVTVADINGDGKPDLIVTNNGASTVSVLLNTTAPGATVPSFATQQTFATPGLPNAVTTADINGDGMPDLIVTSFLNNNVSVLLNTTAPGAATSSFATRQSFTTGSQPGAVRTADINGDGKADLIVVNEGSNTVSVLLNTTAPGATISSFAAQQTFSTGTSPVSVAVTDLNSDGALDLVVANNGANTVSVLLNQTTPGATAASFATQQSFTTGAGPASVVAKDINSDGKPDVIISDLLGNSVSVLVNMTASGATTFAFMPQQAFAAGTHPNAVVVADLNSDGLPDLLTVNSSSNSLSVLLNTVTPNAAAPNFAGTGFDFQFVGGSPWFALPIAAADINGDGKPDLITGGDGQHILVAINTTAPGAATPSFTAPVPFAVGSLPSSLTMADINGDGKPDVIAVNNLDGTASVLINTTPPGAMTPSFAAQQTFATGTSPYEVTTADVNGDGKPDLVIENLGDRTVSVLINTTTPGSNTASFIAQQVFATPGAGGGFSVTAADINGDGLPDLVIAMQSPANSGIVSILINTTAAGSNTASFAAQQTYTVGHQPSSVRAVDVNSDGKPDLVVGDISDNSVAVLLNTTTPGSATPAFTTPISFATGGSFQAQGVPLSIADVNGDGRSDAIFVNQTDGALSVLLNTTTPGAATPSFATQQTVPTSVLSGAVTVADFNGDGQVDIATEDPLDESVTVFLNTRLQVALYYSLTGGTIHLDTTPDAFSFAALTGVPLRTAESSNTVTISGITKPSPISVSGGTYSINGGSYTSAAGTVNNGDTVTVQLTSSSSPSTASKATLTIGGLSADFSVTTTTPATQQGSTPSSSNGGGGAYSPSLLFLLGIMVLIRRHQLQISKKLISL